MRYHLKRRPSFSFIVHLYGIQAIEIIVRYQINLSPYDNANGDLGNIGIVAFCHGYPLRRAIPYIGVYKIGLKGLPVAAELKMRPDNFSSPIVILDGISHFLGRSGQRLTTHDVSQFSARPSE
jgi:hypothetical protein